MAPEAVSRQHYGKGCDIWGAGVLLHVLLSGRLPFLGSGKRLQDVISRGRIAVIVFIYKCIRFILASFLIATKNVLWQMNLSNQTRMKIRLNIPIFYISYMQNEFYTNLLPKLLLKIMLLE